MLVYSAAFFMMDPFLLEVVILFYFFSYPQQVVFLEMEELCVQGFGTVSQSNQSPRSSRISFYVKILACGSCMKRVKFIWSLCTTCRLKGPVSHGSILFLTQSILKDRQQSFLAASLDEKAKVFLQLS